MALADEKQKLFDYIELSLGGGMVDVELDTAHYEASLQKALDVYRQKSSNGSEESYGFLELVKEQNEYILPDAVENVREVFRRSTGGSTGSIFEPFEAGYLNTYMLTAGKVGGLATYDFYRQYQEMAGRMFGAYLNFTFDPVSKRLTIIRNVRSDGESVLLWMYNTRPDESILSDTRSKPWIYDYALARSKYMLGEARSKFATIAGPQGGTSLNGDALKAEAQTELDKLEQDLYNLVDGQMPMTWVIG
jgi:hypothetical protein